MSEKAKLHRISSNGVLLGYMMQCPGCKGHHAIYTEQPNSQKAKWEFNGDLEFPTFKPSVLVTWDEGEEHVKNICHFYVTDGKIIFQPDCTHELKGQTVDLLEWEI